jgi:hypothetical protein
LLALKHNDVTPASWTQLNRRKSPPFRTRQILIVPSKSPDARNSESPLNAKLNTLFACAMNFSYPIFDQNEFYFLLVNQLASNHAFF